MLKQRKTENPQKRRFVQGRQMFLRLVNKMLGRWRRKLINLGYWNPYEAAFHGAYHPDFVFVQIGANDGITNDPLHGLVTTVKCRGFVLEPLPDIFERLKKTYEKYPHITPLQLAIHESDRRTRIYRVSPNRTDLPSWAAGIGSLDPLQHKKNGIPDDAMVAQEVDCISLAELFTLIGTTQIDMLQIDTEGYDARILEMLWKTNVRPKVICFEHGLADQFMSWSDFERIQKNFISEDYMVVMLKCDCIAFRRE